MKIKTSNNRKIKIKNNLRNNVILKIKLIGKNQLKNNANTQSKINK